MKDSLAGLIGALVLIAAGALLLCWSWYPDPEDKGPVEMQTKVRHIAFKGSSYHVEVITVDGVEYLVASTYHGVAICRK